MLPLGIRNRHTCIFGKMIMQALKHLEYFFSFSLKADKQNSLKHSETPCNATSLSYQSMFLIEKRYSKVQIDDEKRIEGRLVLRKIISFN